MLLLPGEILNKRYRIVSLLAAGAYGAVYRAYDTVDGRDYAIKEYRDASIAAQKAFRAEARRLTRLAHPQLPPVRDHFSLEDGGQYLISDYVDGVDLRALQAQYGPLPSDLIIGWLQAACEPLAYLHEQEQLHLNVKPANIRVAPDGAVFLVDTGLPGLGIHRHDQGYGAPEQQAQTAVSPAADIYSLGATLYTLLTDRVPPAALQRETGMVELEPAREVNPDVEPYLSIVATRAMSLRPDARYETVGDFAQALNRPAGRPLPRATQEPRRVPTGTGAPGAPPLRRSQAPGRQIERRTLLGLGAAFVVLLVLIGVFAFVNLERPTEAAGPEATATLESAVIAALTALAPTPTPVPEPSATPVPTPAPITDEKTDMRMVYVPAGTFLMGSDDEGENDEQPAHLVDLDSYYIDQTEVTNGQYRRCVEAGDCAPPDRPGATYHESYYGDPAYDNYPVIFVNWFDAQTFCEWRGARLPSEAEWEKAAGYDPEQSIKLQYPWGNEFDGVRLNFCGAGCFRADGSSSVDDGYTDTAPVGSYPDGRSPLGAYDMLGNVMEWVQDWYDPRYYREAQTDTNPLGPLEGEFKSIRGGSWLTNPDQLRVSARSSFDPTVSRAHLGFRCAMAPP